MANQTDGLARPMTLRGHNPAAEVYDTDLVDGIGRLNLRTLARSAAQLSRRQALALIVLALWAVLPLAVLVVRVAEHGGVLTGTYGTDAFDQMQYLAWIRDAGMHGLASNLWQISTTPHDYLQPMYFFSGVLGDWA
jgi:hypothetical protein